MIKTIKYSAAVLLTALFLSSCSPSARLERLVEKHPDLTYTQTDTVYQPDFRIDTVYKVDQDTSGLSDFVDSLLNVYSVDTNCRDEVITITNKTTEYITSLECIKDTITYIKTLSTDSTEATLKLQVYQTGDTISLSAELLDSKVLVYKTVLKPISKKEGFLSREGEIALMFFTLIFIFLALTKNKHE